MESTAGRSFPNNANPLIILSIENMVVACIGPGGHIFFYAFLFISPTGGGLIGLSAAWLTGVAAAAAHGNDLFHVVPEKKPQLFP